MMSLPNSKGNETFLLSNANSQFCLKLPQVAQNDMPSRQKLVLDRKDLLISRDITPLMIGSTTIRNRKSELYIQYKKNLSLNRLPANGRLEHIAFDDGVRVFEVKCISE